MRNEPMRTYPRPGLPCHLDGQPVANWTWCDPVVGEVAVPEVHWRTGEPVLGADGQPAKCVLKGLVSVGPAPAPVEEAWPVELMIHAQERHLAAVRGRSLRSGGRSDG